MFWRLFIACGRGMAQVTMLPCAPVVRDVKAECGACVDFGRIGRARCHRKGSGKDNQMPGVSLERLETILPDIRKRGLARGEGMPIPGFNSISAPVFDGDGETVLVLTLFGVAATFDVAWKGTIATSLLETTELLTEQNANRTESPA